MPGQKMPPLKLSQKKSTPWARARDVGGRRERGVIFWNRIRQLKGDHGLTIVPTCGHDEFCMYGSDEMVQALLF